MENYWGFQGYSPYSYTQIVAISVITPISLKNDVLHVPIGKDHI